MKHVLISLSFLAVGSLLATNPAQEFQMGNQFAADLLKAGSAVKIDEILGAPNANPPEAGYREAELENKAQGLIKEGTTFGVIKESALSREQYKIDSSTDPIIQISNQIAESPLNVIGGKDTKVVKINAPRETRTVTCEEAGDPSQEICKGRLNIKFVNETKERTRAGKININISLTNSYKNDWRPADAYKSEFEGPCHDLKILLKPPLIQEGKSRRYKYGSRSRVTGYPLEIQDITNEVRACIQNGGKDISFPFKIDLSSLKKVTLKSGTAKNWMHRGYTGHAWIHDAHYLIADLNVEFTDEVTEKVPGEEEWLWACDDLEARADQGLCTYETF